MADKFADIYNMVKRSLWKGGNVISWGIYAPDELLSYQVGASNLFSKRMYKDIFLEHDRKVIKEFEYSLVHTHYNWAARNRKPHKDR